MSEAEQFDVVILGSGQGGKLLAWDLARSGKKVAVVERQWVGGSCPAVACMPSKNEIWSAQCSSRISSRMSCAISSGLRSDVNIKRVRACLSRM